MPIKGFDEAIGAKEVRYVDRQNWMRTLDGN
jgi:hypothetical protein